MFVLRVLERDHSSNSTQSQSMERSEFTLGLAKKIASTEVLEAETDVSPLPLHRAETLARTIDG